MSPEILIFNIGEGIYFVNPEGHEHSGFIKCEIQRYGKGPFFIYDIKDVNPGTGHPQHLIIKNKGEVIREVILDNNPAIFSGFWFTRTPW